MVYDETKTKNLERMLAYCDMINTLKDNIMKNESFYI